MERAAGGPGEQQTLGGYWGGGKLFCFRRKRNSINEKADSVLEGGAEIGMRPGIVERSSAGVYVDRRGSGI
jgi:hypothetical protein